MALKFFSNGTFVWREHLLFLLVLVVWICFFFPILLGQCLSSHWLCAFLCLRIGTKRKEMNSISREWMISISTNSTRRIARVRLFSSLFVFVLFVLKNDQSSRSIRQSSFVEFYRFSRQNKRMILLFFVFPAALSLSLSLSAQINRCRTLTVTCFLYPIAKQFSIRFESNQQILWSFLLSVLFMLHVKKGRWAQILFFSFHMAKDASSNYGC